EVERRLGMRRAAGLPDDVARAFTHLVMAAAINRSCDLADRYLEPGLTYTGERGLILWESYLHAYGAKIALDRGRWDEARDLAALVFQKQLTSTSPRILALVVQGLLYARRGDRSAATLLREALQLAEPSGELLRIGHVALAEAEAPWRS